ncbi:MAG: DUF5615 family PIN-like protein [Candidatus Omnitrophica bacterium]|nr:DUF5615 family PIN-like protein [Candidatus Omnitrophota bacterium]
MRFLLDENFPKAAIQLLQNRGYSCLDFREIGDEGALDRVIFDLAIEKNAVLLTTDRDFFHTIPHLYPEHPGVVVVALHQPNRKNILERLEWLLDRHGAKEVRSTVFELRDSTYIVLRSETE